METFKYNYTTEQKSLIKVLRRKTSLGLVQCAQILEKYNWDYFKAFIEAWSLNKSFKLIDMNDFKTRLLEERNQLSERVNKLDAFFESGKVLTLSTIQQDLLYEQFVAMITYLDCLERRIDDLDNNITN